MPASARLCDALDIIPPLCPRLDLCTLFALRIFLSVLQLHYRLSFRSGIMMDASVVRGVYFPVHCQSAQAFVMQAGGRTHSASTHTTSYYRSHPSVEYKTCLS